MNFLVVQVYIAELEADVNTCINRNIHKWTEYDVEKVAIHLTMSVQSLFLSLCHCLSQFLSVFALLVVSLSQFVFASVFVFNCLSFCLCVSM